MESLDRDGFEDREQHDFVPSEGITRRRLLAAGGQGAVAFGAAGLLSACGGSGQSATTSSQAASGSPVRGGTLNVGMITGGTAETLNPATVNANVDLVRTYQLFDRLFDATPEIKTLAPRLALSAESNKDATVWTLHLRDGVVWHDGKPFGADDVVWTFQAWANPSNYGHGGVAAVDFKRVRKLDRLTVEVPLLRPVAQFPTVLPGQNRGVIQNGATNSQLNSHPVGTGPFKFVSFTPGKQSIFAANPHYWEKGKPYVDKLVVDSSFTDENSRLNALLSGAIDVSPVFPFLPAKTYRNSHQVTVLRAASPLAYIIWMRVDKGPFADVRVRQAMKLIADRPALIEGALLGFGTLANDLQGGDTQYYASNLPQRSQDIEQAKSLLKAAGREGLSFALPTSNVFPGFTQSATLFAQQAKAAGVNVSVQEIPPATYYTSASGFLTRPICVDAGASFPSLTVVYNQQYTATSPFNESHWGSQQPGGPAASRLITQAIAEPDPAKAEQLWAEVQSQQYNQGGALAWGTSDYLDAVGPKVQGLKTTAAFNLNNFRLLDGWIGKS